MMSIFLIVLISLALIVLAFIALQRGNLKSRLEGAERLEGKLEALEKDQEKLARLISDGAFKSRQEANNNAQQGRDELSKALKLFNDSTEQRLEKMRETVEVKLP